MHKDEAIYAAQYFGILNFTVGLALHSYHCGVQERCLVYITAVFECAVQGKRTVSQMKATIDQKTSLAQGSAAVCQLMKFFIGIMPHDALDEGSAANNRRMSRATIAF